MNEFDFLDKLRRKVASTSSSSGVIRGIGDDAAIIRASADAGTVVTTDLLVEDIDFKRNTTKPKLLGHKTLAVSLSDIAAMGARPRWSLVSLGVPADVWETGFVDDFYESYLKLAAKYDIALIGGDVSRTPDKIVIDSIVMGQSPLRGAILRDGANVGDQIFVTGFLGDAAAGLRLIEHGAKLHDDSSSERTTKSVDHLLFRHLAPEPRVGWGILLGTQGLATAMIDISDGLSSDVNHLCNESKAGALIDASSLPIDQVVREICGRRALDPLMLALHGGEDFELLFTVRPEDVSKLPARVDGVSFTRIGEVRNRSEGVRISEGARVWNLEPSGWEHFKE